MSESASPPSAASTQDSSHAAAGIRSQQVVLDTNAVLDLLVFRDPSAQALMHALQSGQLRWVATTHLLEELRRVLDYPAVRARAPEDASDERWTAELLGQSAKLVHLHTAPLHPCPVRCLDADDQPFLDLAHTLTCPLISKDKRVQQAARKARLICVPHGDALLALPGLR
ncbi:MAG TPA: PIN domain-containing protein [Burkholderiaceae bacterium]|nr:PIN domain-containing protein [Burkholderiaceae bacterium]